MKRVTVIITTIFITFISLAKLNDGMYSINSHNGTTEYYLSIIVSKSKIQSFTFSVSDNGVPLVLSSKDFREANTKLSNNLYGKTTLKDIEVEYKEPIKTEFLNMLEELKKTGIEQ